jgi:hypothetical protein
MAGWRPTTTAPNALGAAWIISALAPVFRPTTFP